MTTQTEAERLAEWLERRQMMMLQDRQAAAELRRLASFNQQLMDEVARLNKAPDYAWPTVQDYEADVGFKVNDAFQMGWDMARTTNDLFKQMGAAHDNTD